MTGDPPQAALLEIVRRVCALADEVKAQTAEIEALRDQLTCRAPKPSKRTVGNVYLPGATIPHSGTKR